MLTGSYLWVCREHVVKISQIRQTYSGGLHGRSDSRGAGAVERRARVQRVRYRVEQGLGWDIALARMNRCRELNVWTPDRACKVQPFLDGQVGIRVTTAAWGQFLECRGEHTELHALGLEGRGRRVTPLLVGHGFASLSCVSPGAAAVMLNNGSRLPRANLDYQFGLYRAIFAKPPASGVASQKS